MGAPDLVRQAYEYIDRGVSVIPVTGKVAAVTWEQYQQRPMTPAEIERNFRSPVVTGIAGVMGAVSGGLACRDFDRPGSYESWRDQFPEPAASLPTAKTATPGHWHVYFRTPEVKTRRLGHGEQHDGELRSRGAYCVLPSSVVNGRRYAWLTEFSAVDQILEIDPSEAGLTNSWGTKVQSEQSELSERKVDRGTERTNVVSYDLTSENEITSIEQAVAVSVPSGHRQNHHQLFILARGLLSVQQHLGRDLTDQERRDAFAGWHEASKTYLRPGRSFDEYFLEFLAALDSAKHPLGGRALVHEAWQAALSAEPPKVQMLSDTRLLMLASLCRELQRQNGAQPFFLSCRVVQQLFELPSHKQAYEWLNGLVRFKVLEVVKRGTQGINGSATRFRYLLDLGGRQ